MKGAIDQAHALLQQEKNSFMPNQFSNPVNPQVHADTTAKEILEDTGGHLDLLVAGVGTGGTLTGIAQELRKTLPNLHIVAVEPENSPVLSGGMPGHHAIQGIGAGFIPPVLDTSLIDTVARIDDRHAIETARACAQKEGIACGISSGAVLASALMWGKKEKFKNKRIVAVLPDFAERYISSDLFEEI